MHLDVTIHICIVIQHPSSACYVKLRVVHAPRMPGIFSRHSGLTIPTASRYARHARAVMHVGIDD